MFFIGQDRFNHHIQSHLITSCLQLALRKVISPEVHILFNPSLCFFFHCSFTTLAGRDVCVDPTQHWVQQTMKMIKQMKN
uniref:Chemokine interleukin-8-like domain-containing protein n=1 Tax=Astyanax mexicanus TaxID=7994 RepID=A0A8B9GS13_ASTMX